MFLIHTEFKYAPEAANPARNRMDSVHRCCVAYLFQSERTRSNAEAFVFFANGLLRVTGDIRKDFPAGCSAAWCLPFIYALVRQNKGALFTPYEACGGMYRAFLALVSPRRLYLALDGSGVRLSEGISPTEEALSRCPGQVTFVVGGPRGYAPWKFSAVMRLLSIRARGDVFAVSLSGPVQFSSNIIAYLQLRNDNESLRPDAAASFYTVDTGTPRRSVTMDHRWKYWPPSSRIRAGR